MFVLGGVTVVVILQRAVVKLPTTTVGEALSVWSVGSLSRDGPKFRRRGKLCPYVSNGTTFFVDRGHTS